MQANIIVTPHGLAGAPARTCLWLVGFTAPARMLLDVSQAAPFARPHIRE
jgi:hypothetical protein